MSPQEIFDTVVRHLAQQGGPSIDDGGDCMYRGPNGRKCAVGPLIPDEKYNPSLEGIAPNHEDFDALPGLPIDLLVSLQVAHDLAAYDGENGTAVWRAPYQRHGDEYSRHGIARGLISVAQKFHLSPAVVSECFPGSAS